MGLLDKIFGHKAQETVVRPSEGYVTMTEMSPVFTSYHGTMYQQELTRAAIERFASACSKLKPESLGTASASVQKLVASRPNEQMTWPTFLARLATLYEVDDTVFVVPSYGRDGVTVRGLWPVKCEYAELIENAGTPWLRFHFATGKTALSKLADTCVISKFQYTSDVFGEENCLDSTMSLIDAQSKAQEHAIADSAKMRFIGAVDGQVRDDDLTKKREGFVKDNMGPDNAGGIVVYDSTFRDVKQLQPYNYTIDSAEMERIQANVCNYFGISPDILQNSYNEETWNAWYEGRIEPFAIKLGEGLTNMLYTPVQIVHGNSLQFSANRLEYASSPAKRNMVRDMVDRGIFSINECREVLQMPPIEGGDARVIRGEYVDASTLAVITAGVQGEQLPNTENDTEFDLGGDDQLYKDSDAHDEDDF